MVGFSSKKTVVKNTTDIGKKAKKKIGRYLEQNGHKIIARNFKTYLYEIDIISIKDDHIYFTEVKYRKSDAFGGGFAAINQQKLAKMKFAADCFIKYHAREMVNYNPLLAVADVAGKDLEIKAWFPIA